MAKRKSRKKKLPDVLKSPIYYGLGLMTAGAFPRPQDRLSANEQSEVSAFSKQMAERTRAVYEYFGVDPATAAAKDNLILAMCFKLFPQGFSFCGGKKRKSVAGNRRQWTVARKRQLIQDVEHAGCAPQVAFERLAGKYRMSADSLKTRYYEARSTLDADFNSLDPTAQLDLLKLWVGMPGTEIQ
jgi:hypothetical protein